MNTFFDGTSLFDTLQATPDANVSLTDGQTFGHDAYTNSAFDHNSSADCYQMDHFAPNNPWNNTPSQGALDAWQSNPLDSSHLAMQQHHAHSQNVSFHSASNANPYTTIDDSGGYIYKHVGDDTTGDWIATVHDGQVYNCNNDYLGHAGADGNVYDEHDKVIGRVDNQGHVYNSVGHHVSDTTCGVVGGAAYLLTVYHGNVP